MTEEWKREKRKARDKVIAKTASNALAMYFAKRALKTLGHDVSWRQFLAANALLRYVAIQVAESAEAAQHQQRDLRNQIRFAYGINNPW